MTNFSRRMAAEARPEPTPAELPALTRPPEGRAGPEDPAQLGAAEPARRAAAARAAWRAAVLRAARSRRGGNAGAAGADAGPKCSTAKDCGDTSKFVCDPATHTCTPFQCSDTNPCPAGQFCHVQSHGEDSGRLLPEVQDSGVSLCGGQTCKGQRNRWNGLLHSSGHETSGRRMHARSNGDDITASECQAGLLCEDDKCQPTCDLWSSTPGCPAKLRLRVLLMRSRRLRRRQHLVRTALHRRRRPMQPRCGQVPGLLRHHHTGVQAVLQTEHRG